MECEVVTTHTLFHHYIRELKNAKEAINQTDKYLKPDSPHYLPNYIEKLEALQSAGQDQLVKIANARSNFKAYQARANQAQDILDNHPKKIALLTGANDVFLAPPEKQNECLYILDQETCKASCSDWDNEDSTSDGTVKFADKKDIELTHEEQTDAVRVWHHNVDVDNVCITDYRSYTDAHCDAIQ